MKFRIPSLLRLAPLPFLVAVHALASCSDDDTTTPSADAGPLSDVTVPKFDAALGDSDDAGDGGAASLSKVQHIVVIYMENHSFDNLYGEFPQAEGLTGLDASATNVQQIEEDGGAYTTLPSADPAFPSTLPNAPFAIEDYVPADAQTRDLHHLFLTEQNQINGGLMNKFVDWSDAKNLVMGHYHTMNLPLAKIAQKYTLCDHFHHAAFGGSFLNHQWLIAARTPVFPNAPASMIQDPAKLNPGDNEAAIIVRDGTNYVVNTAQSQNTPHRPGTDPTQLVPNQTYDTIGDRLSDKGLDWAWYSGGWNDALAAAANPDAAPPDYDEENFQYHHQPFVYFAKYADGTDAKKAHLKDEIDFLAAVQAGTLPAVSFVKPVGIDNEHPGYADVARGDQHAADLVNAILNGPNGQDTMIIVTYDEHGGFWDHVAPPTSVDGWGPGSRVPTIVIGPLAKVGFVDSTVYDTTSILATIEHRFGLSPLADRDSKATDLSNTLMP